MSGTLIPTQVHLRQSMRSPSQVPELAAWSGVSSMCLSLCGRSFQNLLFECCSDGYQQWNYWMFIPSRKWTIWLAYYFRIQFWLLFIYAFLYNWHVKRHDSETCPRRVVQQVCHVSFMYHYVTGIFYRNIPKKRNLLFQIYFMYHYLLGILRRVC